MNTVIKLRRERGEGAVRTFQKEPFLHSGEHSLTSNGNTFQRFSRFVLTFSHSGFSSYFSQIRGAASFSLDISKDLKLTRGIILSVFHLWQCLPAFPSLWASTLYPSDGFHPLTIKTIGLFLWVAVMGPITDFNHGSY